MYRSTLVVTLTVMLANCVEDGATCGRDVTARRYDMAQGCLGAFEKVGCVGEDTSCPAAATYAVDGDGRCFWFRDLCLPPGFTRASADDRCPASPAAPMMCPM